MKKWIIVLFLLFILAQLSFAGWVQQNSGTAANLRSVYFINSQTGWVAGDSGFVLRTTDGGNHWTRHVIDSSVSYSRVIRFWDASMGFVCGSNGLYKSTNGGQNWRNIPQSFMNPPYEIVLVTPQKGWLVGFVLATGDGGRGSLYQTTDGGEIWVLRDSSSRYAFRDVAFADSLFGMVTTDNHAVFNLISQGYMKRTTNGGATWDTVNLGPVAYGKLRFRGPNYAWRSRHSFIPGGSHYYGVQKTTNRGGAWSDIWTGYPISLAIPDSLKGWILGARDTLFNTRDAGFTWSWQIPPGSYKNDIYFVDSLNGWLVGQDGLILHTTDGGSGVWSEPLRLTPYASRLTVVPDPFISFTSAPGHSSDRFSLYDISGRKVGTYKGDRIGEGLSAGVYFLCPETRLPTSDTRIVRVVKLR